MSAPAPALSEPSAVATLAQLSPVDLVRWFAVLDRRQLSGVDLRHVLAAEARLLAWVQAGMAATVNELTLCPPASRVPSARTDDPQEFAVEEVALILRVSPGTAGRIVDAAYDAVVRHPGLWRAWRDGEVDARKMAVVGRVTSPSTAEQAATVDRILLDRTAPAAGGWSAWEETVRQPPRSLQHRAEVALAAIDADAGRVRTESALQRRRLVGGAAEGVLGAGFLAGYDLPIADVAAAYQRVDGIARGIKRAGDDRLLDQLRVDVFIDLLLGNEPRTDGVGTAAGAGAAVERAGGGRGVDLVVSVGVLADLEASLKVGRTAEVAGFGLVPADVAARLVAEAAGRPSSWCLTVVEDDGRVVAHVRTRHDPTTAMHDFVEGRDRECRFPGCARTAAGCDQDHTIPWERGGPTCPCNLAPLCRRHHRLKQASGWRVEIDPNTNDASWTSPHAVQVVDSASARTRRMPLEKGTCVMVDLRRSALLPRIAGRARGLDHVRRAIWTASMLTL